MESIDELIFLFGEELVDAWLQSYQTEVEDVYEKLIIEEFITTIRHVLTLEEYDIICRRFGIGYDVITQADLAEQMGVSRSYLSRIEKRALFKIKQQIKK